MIRVNEETGDLYEDGTDEYGNETTSPSGDSSGSSLVDTGAWERLLKNLGFSGANVGTFAGGLGLAGLLGKAFGGGSPDLGYKGSIPNLVASRTMLPIPPSTTGYVPPAAGSTAPVVAPRRPGSGGVTYFSPMVYSPLTPPPPAAGTTPPADATTPGSTGLSPPGTITPAQEVGPGGYAHGGLASLRHFDAGGSTSSPANARLASIAAFLKTNPTPAALAAAMQQYGVSQADLTAARALTATTPTTNNPIHNYAQTLNWSTPATSAASSRALYQKSLQEGWDTNRVAAALGLDPNALSSQWRDIFMSGLLGAGTGGGGSAAAPAQTPAAGTPSFVVGGTPTTSPPAASPPPATTTPPASGTTPPAASPPPASGTTTPLVFSGPRYGNTFTGGPGSSPAQLAASLDAFQRQQQASRDAFNTGLQNYDPAVLDAIATARGRISSMMPNYAFGPGPDRTGFGRPSGSVDPFITANTVARIPGYARGGIASLVPPPPMNYARGRLLNGPGDGVSDSIPATIDGNQPAALADGEYVIPARIVSELGNGSTKAGAKQLDAMMKRIQASRRKATDIAANTRVDRHLPA